jgi:phosphoinositide-3-kinase regulatory subunit 4
MISTHQQQLHKSHQDCVTALALLDSPFRGCVVSGDRSGTIKVLRVDVE